MRTRLGSFLGLLLSITLFTGCPVEIKNVFHVYLTWHQEDTSTTMTVVYHHTDHDFEESQVFYDTESRGGSPSEYRLTKKGYARNIDGLSRRVHFVELTELVPNQTYYFIAGDSKNGFSPERKFRTIPSDNSPIKFVTGGDIGLDPQVLALHHQAARTEPLFALIGGDLAYENGDRDEIGSLDAWLWAYEREMVTPEGYTVPMALAIGNHETNGQSGGAEQKAPFYTGLFRQDETTHFVRQFGPRIVTFFLDTGHIDTHESQVPWLSEQLKQHEQTPLKFAIYHVPLYPTHRDYDNDGSVAGRKHWLPLFDQYHLTMGFENHDHTMKRTHLLRGNRVVENHGTYFIGDGCWGKPARDFNKMWYVARAASQRHFWTVNVGANEIVLEAINEAGVVFDQFKFDPMTSKRLR